MQWRSDDRSRYGDLRKREWAVRQSGQTLIRVDAGWEARRIAISDGSR
jgi:hypothetical protein